MFCCLRSFGQNISVTFTGTGAATHIDSVTATNPYYYVYGYNGTTVSAAKATANYTTYGVLYNWPAAMNGAVSSYSVPSGVQGICPPACDRSSHGGNVMRDACSSYGYTGPLECVGMDAGPGWLQVPGCRLRISRKNPVLRFLNLCRQGGPGSAVVW